MHHSVFGRLLLSLTAVAGTSALFASGFSILEQSTVGLGRSLAGMTAETSDPGALYFNPATGAFHDEVVLMTGFHYIDTYGKFHDDGTTTGTGSTDDYFTNPAVVPNVYYIHPVADGITLNLGISATSGTATDYDSNWKGRYFATETNVAVIELSPSISWKINPQLSIGASFNAQFCNAILARHLDFSAAGANDGKVKLEGDSWAFGFSAGIMYQPFDSTRVGLGYRSRMTHDVSMKATIHGNSAVMEAAGLLPHDTAICTINLPSTINFGVQQDITDNLTIMADIAWSQWSILEDLDAKFQKAHRSEDMPMKWKDSWRYCVGAQYKASEKWTLRCGATYDRSPIPDKYHRYPSLPDVDRLWFSLGAGCQVTDSIVIDFAFTRLLFIADVGDNTDAAGHHLAGEYTGHTHIFSLALTKTF